MAYVDFKVTAWERVIVSDENLPKILEKIKSGEITSSNELSDLYGDDAYFEGVIDDTAIQMTTAENDNNSTIEVYEDTDLIYSNV